MEKLKKFYCLKKILCQVLVCVFFVSISNFGFSQDLNNKFRKKYRIYQKMGDTLLHIVYVAHVLDDSQLKNRFKKRGRIFIKEVYPYIIKSSDNKVYVLIDQFQMAKDAYLRYLALENAVAILKQRIFLNNSLSKLKDEISILDDIVDLKVRYSDLAKRIPLVRSEAVQYKYQKAVMLLADSSKKSARMAYYDLKTVIDLDPTYKDAKDLQRNALSRAIYTVFLAPVKWLQTTNRRLAAEVLNVELRRYRDRFKNLMFIRFVSKETKQPDIIVHLQVNSVRFLRERYEPIHRNRSKTITKDGKERTVKVAITEFTKTESCFVDVSLLVKDKTHSGLFKEQSIDVSGHYSYHHTWIKFSGNHEAIPENLRHYIGGKERPYKEKNVMITAACQSFADRHFKPIFKVFKELGQH